MSPVALQLPFDTPLVIKPRTSQLHSVEPTSAAPQSTRSHRRQVWLAVHLKNWSLLAALSAMDQTTRTHLLASPLAVVGSDRRNSVLAYNTVAAKVGIRVGHSLNAAIALCSDTQFLPRNEGAEIQLLKEMAHHGAAYTSFVSVQPPNEILLEVRGSFRLFGGVQALTNRVRDDFFSRGCEPQIALSATAQSALWLARAASSPVVVKPRELSASISRLPVSILQWPVDLEMTLARFGVLCIGDLLRLPRGGLACRIGHDQLKELDQAVGRHPQVRKAEQATETYDDPVILDFEIETTRLLSQRLERQFSRLDRYLRSRNLAVEEVLIDLSHRDASVTPVKIGLASPTSDLVHVTKLMHEHLGRLQLPAPVYALRIRVPRLCPAPSSTHELFRDMAGREAARADTTLQARLLEQLRSRLGANAVKCLVAVADHRPERAHSVDEATVQKISQPGELPEQLPPRPLWIVSPPQKIVRPRRWLRGPETLASGWWDGQPVDRSYFHVRSPQGALAWVYQDRRQPERWSLHGLFA